MTVSLSLYHSCMDAVLVLLTVQRSGSDWRWKVAKGARSYCQNDAFTRSWIAQYSDVHHAYWPPQVSDQGAVTSSTAVSVNDTIPTAAVRPRLLDALTTATVPWQKVVINLYDRHVITEGLGHLPPSLCLPPPKKKNLTDIILAAIILLYDRPMHSPQCSSPLHLQKH